MVIMMYHMVEMKIHGKRPVNLLLPGLSIENLLYFLLCTPVQVYSRDYPVIIFCANTRAYSFHIESARDYMCMLSKRRTVTCRVVIYATKLLENTSLNGGRMSILRHVCLL